MKALGKQEGWNADELGIPPPGRLPGYKNPLVKVPTERGEQMVPEKKYVPPAPAEAKKPTPPRKKGEGEPFGTPPKDWPEHYYTKAEAQAYKEYAKSRGLPEEDINKIKATTYKRERQLQAERKEYFKQWEQRNERKGSDKAGATTTTEPPKKS